LEVWLFQKWKNRCKIETEISLFFNFGLQGLYFKFNMIMIQCDKYNRRKKEREGEREVNKTGRKSCPFCSLLSFHEPNVYFGRNSRPIYKGFEVKEISHSTDRYRKTNKKCTFSFEPGFELRTS
jgi:hypothetical protein